MEVEELMRVSLTCVVQEIANMIAEGRREWGPQSRIKIGRRTHQSL
jgi:hypothetical protein